MASQENNFLNSCNVTVDELILHISHLSTNIDSTILKYVFNNNCLPHDNEIDPEDLRLMKLIHPPSDTDITDWLVDKDERWIPKGAKLIDAKCGFSSILQRSLYYMYDKKINKKGQLISELDMFLRLADCISYDVYKSRTYTTTALYLVNAKIESKKTDKVDVVNKQAITYLQKAMTSLRKLSPFSPTVQRLMCETTLLMAKEFYSNILYFDKKGWDIYKRLIKTPSITATRGIISALHNLSKTLATINENKLCLERRLAALKNSEIFYYYLSENAETAALASNVGLLYDVIGDKLTALKYKQYGYDMFVRIERKKSINHSYALATALNNLGITYQEVGKIAYGIKLQEEALAMKRVLYNNLPHEKIAQDLNNLGSSFISTSYREKGMALIFEAIEMNKYLFKTQNIGISQKSKILGMNYANLGCFFMHIDNEIMIAKNYLEKALKYCKNVTEDTVATKETMATLLNNLGIVEDAIGNKTKGLFYKLQALYIRTKLYSKSTAESLAVSLSATGESYFLTNIGRSPTAINNRKKGLEFIKTSIRICRYLGIEGLEMLLCVNTLLSHIDENDAIYTVLEFLTSLNIIYLYLSSYHKVQLLQSFHNIIAKGNFPLLKALLYLKKVGASEAKNMEQKKLSFSIQSNVEIKQWHKENIEDIKTSLLSNVNNIELWVQKALDGLIKEMYYSQYNIHKHFTKIISLNVTHYASKFLSDLNINKENNICLPYNTIDPDLNAIYQKYRMAYSNNNEEPSTDGADDISSTCSTHIALKDDDIEDDDIILQQKIVLTDKHLVGLSHEKIMFLKQNNYLSGAKWLMRNNSHIEISKRETLLSVTEMITFFESYNKRHQN